MKNLVILISVIYISIAFTGCIKNLPSQVSANKTMPKDNNNTASTKIENTDEFIKLLEKSGYKIQITKGNKKGLLSGTLETVTIDGDIIGVYEYKNNQEMEQDAKTIGSDGSQIGFTIFDFKSKPHFYKKGNIIVSYIGDNKETIKKIEKLMGEQFAGSNIEKPLPTSYEELNKLSQKYTPELARKNDDVVTVHSD